MVHRLLVKSSAAHSVFGSIENSLVTRCQSSFFEVIPSISSCLGKYLRRPLRGHSGPSGELVVYVCRSNSHVQCFSITVSLAPLSRPIHIPLEASRFRLSIRRFCFPQKPAPYKPCHQSSHNLSTCQSRTIYRVPRILRLVRPYSLVPFDIIIKTKWLR